MTVALVMLSIMRQCRFKSLTNVIGKAAEMANSLDTAFLSLSMVKCLSVVEKIRKLINNCTGVASI